MNRTGGPVRPRQNYTYATPENCCAASFATRLPADDTECWLHVDMWVTVPGCAPPTRADARGAAAPRPPRVSPSSQFVSVVLGRPSSTERACAASIAAI